MAEDVGKMASSDVSPGRVMRLVRHTMSSGDLIAGDQARCIVTVQIALFTADRSSPQLGL